MENSKYEIKMNRYPENIILEAWEKADKTKNTILVDSCELDFSIEIERYENTTNDVVVSFLLHIGEIDNIVQEFCKNSFQHGKLNLLLYYSFPHLLYINFFTTLSLYYQKNVPNCFSEFLGKFFNIHNVQTPFWHLYL